LFQKSQDADREDPEELAERALLARPSEEDLIGVPEMGAQQGGLPPCSGNPKTPIGKIQKNLLKEPYWRRHRKKI